MSLKTDIEKALRAAMAASLAAKASVPVQHPLFDGFKLRCRTGYQKPSIYPTKFVSLKTPDGRGIWSTTAAYIGGLAGDIARRGTVERQDVRPDQEELITKALECQEVSDAQ